MRCCASFSLSLSPPSSLSIFVKPPRADRRSLTYGPSISPKFTLMVVVRYNPFENLGTLRASCTTFSSRRCLTAPTITIFQFVAAFFTHTRSFSLLIHCIYMHIHIDSSLHLHTHVSCPLLDIVLIYCTLDVGTSQVEFVVETKILACDLRKNLIYKHGI